MLAKYLGKCTKEAISDIQAKYSLTFPADYAAFLMEYNGAIAGEEAVVVLPSIANYIELDSLFGLNCDRKWLDFEYWMDKYCDELPHDGAIIGRDVLGGFLVLVCRGEDAGVYYWDTALNYDTSTPNSNAYPIADSFADFFKAIQH